MAQSGSVRIHRLGPGDVAIMRAVNAMFRVAFEEVETFAAAPPDDDYLARVLGEKHVVALAALAGGEAIGGLVGYELDKLERARREFYIYDLAVAAPHRRRGVATALIGEARRIAAARGAWVVYVQADPEDGPAVALYTKLGAREDVLHFDIAP